MKNEVNASAARKAGEYPGVVRLSADPEALLRLHGTQIGGLDAIALVEAIFAREGRPAPKVEFRGYRGRAQVGRGLLLLPSVSHRKASEKGIGSLRVGIVLHECAHFFAARETKQVVGRMFGRMYGGTPVTYTRRVVHGPAFVAALDRLVRDYVTRVTPAPENNS